MDQPGFNRSGSSSNWTSSTGVSVVHGVSDVVLESVWAMGVGGGAIGLNVLFGLFLICRPANVRLRNSFIIHHCFLDLVKGTLAFFLLADMVRVEKKFPTLSSCDTIGGAYITFVTCSVLNIAAMMAAEAYNYVSVTSRLQGLDGDKTNSSPGVKPKKEGECGCICFGLGIIWVSAVIVHLGITLIGNNPEQFYNIATHRCQFTFRTKRVHILYGHWVSITVVALIVTVHYLRVTYREIVRHSQGLLQSRTPLVMLNKQRRNVISIFDETTRRIRTIVILNIAFMVCWLPLFICICIDPNFNFPDRVYRTLNNFALAHSAITPLCYFLLIKKCYQLCCRCGKNANEEQYRSVSTYLDRVGRRLNREVGPCADLEMQSDEAKSRSLTRGEFIPMQPMGSMPNGVFL